ncbi:MAG: UTP-glucose-1-phosphate uridylyltransferase [Parcubacteria group bacterium Greene0714_21]|nr:MAG: UTP-glucose-1-phosphate uridylyltransferase [Parcubacteria group bacterium Greene0416_39]TSC97945.1 MAG: UTP-glucose-1-phosphate uridylyltransferase [Parcubacteria group bacterium Greene1014_47]TSD04538.1 MAG: UTP-glucose-1-phosphate uridylyltransferase [Parcubacteria group bacterium Greene0714_21]
MTEITKAIVPAAGLATRFFPLSKAVSKEFLPLADKPLVHYALEEMVDSGVKHVVFVVDARNFRFLSEYLKRSPILEKLLEERKATQALEELKGLQKAFEGMSFSFVQQTRPLGEGHAILQAQKLIGDEPCFVLSPDDVIESKVPALAQLAKIFRSAQCPVTGLFALPEDQLHLYGVCQGEQIATRLTKIRKIMEKPEPGTAPSNLAMPGRRIITPDVFDYLKKAKPNKQGEISFGETLGDMVNEGRVMYGYELEGKWLECGNKKAWMRSNLYLMQKFLKDEHI